MCLGYTSLKCLEYNLFMKRILYTLLITSFIIQPSYAFTENFSIKNLFQNKEERAVTKLSEEAKLPIIRNISGKYTIEGYQHKEFNVDGGVESFQFKKAIRETDGFSFTALLIVLLIHTLLLFNYIVAYRTSTLDINDSEEDGGRIL